jgi:hypothetical protein
VGVIVAVVLILAGAATAVAGGVFLFGPVGALVGGLAALLAGVLVDWEEAVHGKRPLPPPPPSVR